jgi:DNA-binding GntR family transcriptional regulator
MIQQMYTHYNRIRRLDVSRGHTLDILLEQHKDIVKAIRERDIVLGKSTIEKHLNKVRVDVLELAGEYPHYFKQPI